MHVHTHTHTHTRACVRACVRTCICGYMHFWNLHAHTHTHTHTHTNTRSVLPLSLMFLAIISAFVHLLLLFFTQNINIFFPFFSFFPSPCHPIPRPPSLLKLFTTPPRQ